MHHPRRMSIALLTLLPLFASGCSGGDAGDNILLFHFPPPPNPLTASDVDTIVMRTAQAIDAPNLIIAVTDRMGRILAVWRRDPAASVTDQNIAVSLARTTSFVSSSQGPLTSRTLEYISTFHFPPVFGAPTPITNPDPLVDVSMLAPQRQTLGIQNTPQGALWQIFTTNRGARLAGLGLTLGSAGLETLFNPPFDPDNGVPPATNIDDTAPGPGLTYLPGAIPLYKDSTRLVGGVGVYGTTLQAAEFAAIAGAAGSGTLADPNFAFPGVPPAGLIFLVGVLLPAFEQTTIPAGMGPGTFNPASYVVGPTDAGPTATFALSPTQRDPYGDLIGPRADPLGALTLADVTQLRDQAIATANGTRAAIRLPLGSATKMVIAITNRNGLILSLHRMDDAPVFSIDVSVAKARNVVYFSSPELDPGDQVPGLPLGVAITNRTLGFLTQPFFPPGIDGTAPGPLFASVALFNQNPLQFNRQGREPFKPGLQNGVVLFPGASALYSPAGVLIGGLGISGDGVEQDDFVTNGAVAGFDAPLAIRADQFSFDGVPLPYFKFPQHPGPGN